MSMNFFSNVCNKKKDSLTHSSNFCSLPLHIYKYILWYLRPFQLLTGSYGLMIKCRELQSNLCNQLGHKVQS